MLDKTIAWNSPKTETLRPYGFAGQNTREFSASGAKVEFAAAASDHDGSAS